MTDVKALLHANAEYVKTYTDDENQSPFPRKRLAIVTCMDAWIHEADIFNIKPADAHIIRNAGGSAKDALNSLIISQQLLKTIHVMVAKHTRCGMMNQTNRGISRVVEEQTGVCAHHIDFLPFDELVQAVKDDVRWLRRNSYMHKIDPKNITGWIVHLETGSLEHVPVD